MDRRKILFVSLAAVLIVVSVASGFLYYSTLRATKLQEEKRENSLTILKRDQGFPIKPTNDAYGKAFVVEDFILEEIPLVSNYFSIAAISAIYEDAQSKQQKLIIPIAVRNSETNIVQINGYFPQEFFQFFNDGDEAFWNSHTGISKGQIIFVTLMMPNEELKNNSTQGFGFETMKDPTTARYTQEGLEEFYQTGNPKFFRDKILWPVVHIYVDTSLNYVDPTEPVQVPIQ